MTQESSQSPEMDLDKTDELPILEGTQFGHDVLDDAVPMGQAAALCGPTMFAGSGTRSDFLLAAARAALESEQGRSRALERVLAERSGLIEAARARAEDALRESERHQSESRTLRDSLVARDATIVQALHSLGERDAQLAALAAEHAKTVPALEAASKTTMRLEADLQAARAQSEARASELQASRAAAAALDRQLERSESELNAARSELRAATTQAGTYLDLLRTREWRREFDQNLFRELDSQVGAAHAGHGALEAERARLQGQLATLQEQLSTKSAAAQAEHARLMAEMEMRDRALEEAGRRDSENAQKIAQLRSEQAEQIARLQAQEETHEQELSVLMAHLQEARRPTQAIDADLKRLTSELAAKSAAFAEADAENRHLRVTLERTRGALEEREFLIRRLERSESNNANVLGRIQTSIERLGSAAAGPSVGAPPTAAWSAELVRIDGQEPVTHVLSPRTRIGRATGCELQIDSGSVSRHHALVVVGSRETLIEDLHSTNGVLVNNRKVSRQVLNDGDTVTIGEIPFRYFARLLPHSPEPNPEQPAAET